ncbi:MAG: hypothetical protein JW808_06385 [Victivallales bacterium]|nr:hypothetical protein [Victivallales bacterium]
MKLLEALRDHSVEFVIIGGHAVCFHGYIRTTEDFDIIINPDDSNKEKLCHALFAMNACWISDEIDPATNSGKTIPVSLEFVKNNHLMMLCTDHGYLDVFDFIPGFPDVSVEQIFQDSQELNGMRYASLEWLLKIKRKSTKPRDIEDIEQLSS